MTCHKILHVLYEGKLAGAETTVKLLVKNLDSSKFENHVCFLHSGGIIADQMRSSGIHIHIIGMKHGFDFISSIKFYFLLKKYSFDLIHYHSPNVLSLMMGYLYKVKLVYHIHNCFLTCGLRKIAFGFYFKRLAGAIAISNAAKENFIDNFGVKREKVALIHNAVDLKAFISAKKNKEIISKYISNDNIVILGYVGRLTPVKGCDLFLEALVHVKAKTDMFHVLVIGEGEQLNKLKQYSRELNLEKNITFLGAQEKVYEYFKMFDVFILPSREEGFGLVVVEGMASGNPVVAFAVGGIPELVRDNVEGFLIQPYDTKAMANKILELISDEKLRKSLGAAGVQRSHLFSLDKHVKGIECFYQRIFNDS